jgi:hypothetical protein
MRLLWCCGLALLLALVAAALLGQGGDPLSAAGGLVALGTGGGRKVADVYIPGPGDLPPLPRTALPPAGASVARSLKDVQWTDSKVIPRGAGPEIPNIVQVGDGLFCCTLRQRGSWHDGDRDMTAGAYARKSRAEMHGLGGDRPMRAGETWLIGTTVWLRKDFAPNGGFCNVMQPVLHQSYLTLERVQGNDVVGALYVFERGLGSRSIRVRGCTFPRGQWTTVVLRVRFGRDGRYELSVNGDAFQGIACDASVGHVQGNRVGVVDAFGGTWGLYCAAGGGDKMVVHAFPWLKRVG